MGEVAGAGTNNEQTGNTTGAPTQPAHKSGALTYVLPTLCLGLGIVAGYLVHPPVVVPKQPAPAAAADAANPHAAMGGKVSPDQLTQMAQQLKQMADKKSEPLLAKLKQDPNNPKLLLELGNLYAAARQYETSIGYYEKAASIKPDANVLTQLASAYHYTGATDKAIDTLARALKLDPNFGNALVNIGMLKWQAHGDSAAAITVWERFLAKNPKDPRRTRVEQMIARAKEHSSIAAGTKTDKPAHF